MKRLIDDITNKSFKTCYLLYGTERYLVTLYKKKLQAALISDDDTMNLNSFEGRGIDWPEVMSLGDTLPFFADHRVIMLDSTGMFKGAGEQGKKLAKWVRELPESTTLIFTENDIDRSSAMYKAINELGIACEMNGPTDNELKIFVASRLKKDNRQIREKNAIYLLHTVGVDMQNLCNELEKLVAYTEGRSEITAEDIDAVCVRQISGKIYHLTDAVATGDKRAAIQQYQIMQQLRIAPMKLLIDITSHFNSLLLAKDLIMHGRNPREIASNLGKSQYVADILYRQCRNFTMDELRLAVEIGIGIENDCKNGNLEIDFAPDYYIVKLLNLK